MNTKGALLVKGPCLPINVSSLLVFLVPIAFISYFPPFSFIVLPSLLCVNVMPIAHALFLASRLSSSLRPLHKGIPPFLLAVDVAYKWWFLCSLSPATGVVVMGLLHLCILKLTQTPGRHVKPAIYIQTYRTCQRSSIVVRH